MKLIVAVDEKWGIGKNGDLLLSIPDDMLYYRQTTRGKVVVMGYNTLLSLPGSKPQPARLNLVLADIKGLKVSGAVVCDSMDQLLTLIGYFYPDDVFDIGGGSLYRQLLPYCSAAHITKMRFDGEADTSIFNLDEMSEWRILNESDRKEYEGIPYSFVEYRNDSPKEIPAAKHLSPDMSAYFKKKTQIDFSLLDCDDESYRKAFCSLLRAYYDPISDGFSAEDVARFLEEGGELSFEQYLKERGMIASYEDFEALNKRFDPESTKKAYHVRILKEDVPAFEKLLKENASVLKIAGTFAAE